MHYGCAMSMLCFRGKFVGMHSGYIHSYPPFFFLFFLFFSFAQIVFSITFCTVFLILYILYSLKDSSQYKLWWWLWWMPLLVHFYYFCLPRMTERGGKQRQRGQRASWSFHIFEQEMRHSKLNFAHCLTLGQLFPWPFRKNGSLSPSTVYVRKLNFELSPSFQIFFPFGQVFFAIVPQIMIQKGKVVTWDISIIIAIISAHTSGPPRVETRNPTGATFVPVNAKAAMRISLYFLDHELPRCVPFSHYLISTSLWRCRWRFQATSTDLP